MYKEYPYTTYFHDIDHMCRMCKSLGYRLEVVGDYLKLVNAKNEVISAVKIHYADTALTDVDGKPIRSYIIEASTGEKTLVLKHGDDTLTTLTIPYATAAEKDVYGKDLTDYAYAVQVSADKLQIVRGDSTIYEITVPFATKAATDVNGKDLTTYAATLAVDGDNIVLRDSEDRELARITAPYAIKALGDADGDTFTTTYAADLTAGTTTITLKNKVGGSLSEITVPYATKALTDVNGNAFLSDYAESIVVDGDGKRIGLNAHDGTRLATITVPFATLATDATNAVETIAISGDQIIFTTFGGQQYAITAPYAVKAQRDDNNNVIKNTYIANVTNDPATGKLTFYDAVGQVIAELTPTVTKATYDNLDNRIADYVKSVVMDNQSDYVLVTHGDGDVDSILINYANHAWKDSLDHPIQNFYVSWLTCEEDIEDGHYKLVMWNGDIPRAEIGRLEITAYKAQCDKNGRDITTYVGNVEVIANKITVSDGTGAIIDEIVGDVDLSNIGTTTATVKSMTTANVPGSLTYDSVTGDVLFTPGTAASATDVTVVTGISGSTVAVDFDD